MMEARGPGGGGEYAKLAATAEIDPPRDDVFFYFGGRSKIDVLFIFGAKPSPWSRKTFK
jgi:hypothetical protein